MEDRQTKKKPYETPQIFRVELDAEQAILTACSIMASSLANGGNRFCYSGGNNCKNGTGIGQGDSGPRLSWGPLGSASRNRLPFMVLWVVSSSTARTIRDFGTPREISILIPWCS